MPPKGLAQRLQAEGARSPVDVILTVDIARLSVLRPTRICWLSVDSAMSLHENIPAHSARSREPLVCLFEACPCDRLSRTAPRTPNQIRRYEDLADPSIGAGTHLRKARQPCLQQGPHRLSYPRLG